MCDLQPGNSYDRAAGGGPGIEFIGDLNCAALPQLANKGMADYFIGVASPKRD
jgi:hypothetical protein